jgi:hypothetical protein
VQKNGAKKGTPDARPQYVHSQCTSKANDAKRSPPFDAKTVRAKLSYALWYSSAKLPRSRDPVGYSLYM